MSKAQTTADGDLNIWLHEYLGGIRPDPEGPGFKKIIIKPEAAGGLTWARDGFDSIHGRISSEWREEDGKFDLRVTIPANTTATVVVPASDPKTVTESARSASESEGVTLLRFERGYAVYQVGSGVYHFKTLTGPR